MMKDWLMLKDWLKLSFFPIENEKELKKLRSMMTPFMRNIRRCYETAKIEKEEKKRICDGIIRTASSHVEPKLKQLLDHIIFQLGSNNTLKLQQQDLENISLK